MESASQAHRFDPGPKDRPLPGLREIQLLSQDAFVLHSHGAHSGSHAHRRTARGKGSLAGGPPPVARRSTP